jgi:transcriptional regulator with XRE-family HTH domain
MTTRKAPPGLAAQRLTELLEKLGREGFNQSQVAGAVGLTPQYLSDIRHSHRPLSELVARRLADRFQVDYRWLLAREVRRPQTELGSPSVPDANAWLPVVPHPVEGEPRVHPRWDGTYVQVPAIAAPLLALALHPYVLRFGHNDVEGRIHKHDLVVISQSPSKSAEISVVRSGNKCFLARRKGRRWVRLANRRELGSDCVVVGHCLGIAWSALT